MPNWCMTTMFFTGEEDELEKLKALIEKWTSKNYLKNDFGTSWLGNVVLGAGFSLNDFECRGSILYIEDILLDDDNNLPFLQIECESAWIPMPEMWYAIVGKYASNCKVYWYAEEPGCELYQTNDIDKLFFKEDYVVEYYPDDKNKDKFTDIFEECTDTYTAKQLTEALHKVYPGDSLDNMIQRLNNEELPGVCDINIHEIELVDQ